MTPSRHRPPDSPLHHRADHPMSRSLRSPSVAAPAIAPLQKLAQANEATWLLIGAVAEQMGELDRALAAYEQALKHNPQSLSALTQIAGIARIRENYPKAVDYFQRVLTIQDDNGEVWSSLGHCYLMQDELQKAYSAYQQALYFLPNPKEDPKLWYGIGILYDRYGSLEHAEEAFSSVLRMDKDFDKANEILFRLGIIYKQQQKYTESLDCFDRILRSPPSPLANVDIWFQIGHVYEQQKDYVRAKDAYERVLADSPNHAKVLQQLGWLHHQPGAPFQNQDLAIQYLTKSLESDATDAQSWYLLGRAYMAGQKYNKAYEAYQQAVYRDGRNPTFWCSIGVLYFQINQFHDALDAYSRAIRINPYISEVWFDLGSLYESCNNQISDAIDAYARASELEPSNPHITARLQLLRNAQANGGQLPAAPGPQDVHPTAYSSTTGQPMLHHGPPPRPFLSRPLSRGSQSESYSGRASPPFRGGPPPPVVLDENRRTTLQAPLAPMDIDRERLPFQRPSSGLPNSQATSGGLLLHHPQPQSQIHHTLPGPIRAPYDRAPSEHSRHLGSRSPSPPPHRQSRHGPSPSPAFPGYQGRPPYGGNRSPRSYPFDGPNGPPRDGQDLRWADRALSDRIRVKDEPRSNGHALHGAPPPPLSGYPHGSPPGPRRPPSTAPMRTQTPRERRRSNSNERSPYPYSNWDSRPSNGHGNGYRSPPPPPPTGSSLDGPSGPRRYDPRFDEREGPPPAPPVDQPQPRYASSGLRNGAGTPDPGTRQPRRTAAQPLATKESSRHHGSESPHPTAPPVQLPEPKPERKRRPPKEKDIEKEKVPKERKKTGGRRAAKDKDIPPPANATPEGQSPGGSGSLKITLNPKGPNRGSGGTEYATPVQTPAPQPPSRVVDEDYDEGVADALMGLSAYRAPQQDAAPASTSASTTLPSLLSVGNLKRPLSPAPSHFESNKKSRTDAHQIPSISPTSQFVPMSPTTMQSGPRTLEHRNILNPDSADSGVTARLSPISSSGPPGPSSQSHIALPPIATLSPSSPSTVASPPEVRRSISPMQIDNSMREQAEVSTRASPAPASPVASSGRHHQRRASQLSQTSLEQPSPRIRSPRTDSSMDTMPAPRLSPIVAGTAQPPPLQRSPTTNGPQRPSPAVSDEPPQHSQRGSVGPPAAASSPHVVTPV